MASLSNGSALEEILAEVPLDSDESELEVEAWEDDATTVKMTRLATCLMMV